MIGVLTRRVYIIQNKANKILHRRCVAPPRAATKALYFSSPPPPLAIRSCNMVPAGSGRNNFEMASDRRSIRSFPGRADCRSDIRLISESPQNLKIDFYRIVRSLLQITSSPITLTQAILSGGHVSIGLVAPLHSRGMRGLSRTRDFARNLGSGREGDGQKGVMSLPRTNRNKTV